MTKMSATQQANVKQAHESAGRGQIMTNGRGRQYLIANGWAYRDGSCVVRPTREGLIAAGIDIDAAHGAALVADRDAELDESEREQASPRGLLNAAVLQAKSYRGALDLLHAAALVDDFLRRPHMVRAIEIGAAERARAAGCYHPRSCRSCSARGAACGAHTPGAAGHERCSGPAAPAAEWSPNPRGGERVVRKSDGRAGVTLSTLAGGPIVNVGVRWDDGKGVWSLERVLGLEPERPAAAVGDRMYVVTFAIRGVRGTDRFVLRADEQGPQVIDRAIRAITSQRRNFQSQAEIDSFEIIEYAPE